MRHTDHVLGYHQWVWNPTEQNSLSVNHSTVTDFARFLGRLHFYLIQVRCNMQLIVMVLH